MQARDLRVPADRDVHLGPSPDGESLRIARKSDQLQLSIAVAHNQKRLVGALRGQDSLQLAWRQRMLREWVSGRPVHGPRTDQAGVVAGGFSPSPASATGLASPSDGSAPG